MAKFRFHKTSFIGGEISGTALGRTDLPQYQHACEELTNMIPLPSGGVYRRPGTFFDAYIGAELNYPPRLIPFIVSKREAYYVLIRKSDTSDDTIISISRPVNNITTSTASLGAQGMPYKYKIALASGANGLYDHVQEIQYSQSVDIMLLVERSTAPIQVIRAGQDLFSVSGFLGTLSAADQVAGIPFRPQNSTATTITPSATTGNGITLTASASFFDTNHGASDFGHGAIIKIDHSGTVGAALITSVSSATTATANVLINFGSNTASALWWESSWSNYRGWPRVTGYYKGRRFYGGNDSNRDSFWFSQTGNYTVMSTLAMIDPRTGPTGIQPFTLEMSSQQFNEIQWASPGDNILVGTQGEEWEIGPEVDTAGFGADNSEARRKTSYGSDYVQAVRFGDEVAMVSQGGGFIQSLVFDQLQSSYKAEPIQILFDEFPRSSGLFKAKKVRGMSWDQSRKTLWAYDASGKFVGVTRDRSLGFSAWHSHKFGGDDPTQIQSTGVLDSIDPAVVSPSGSVISMCILPNPSLPENDVWLVIKRKITSGSSAGFYYYIERIIGALIPFESAYDYNSNLSGGIYFTDSSKIAQNDYPSTEDFSFSPTMSHIEGFTPEGTIIGATGYFSCEGTVVNSSGVTAPTRFPPGFDSADFDMVMGLPFEGIIRPVRIEAGSQIGSAQSAEKRIHELTLRFYRTLAAKIGRDADTLETIIFRDGDTPMGSSAELFTGDKIVDFMGDYDRDGYIYVLADKPLPFALMSIIAEGETND